MSTNTIGSARVATTTEYPRRIPILFGIFTAVAVFGWIVSTFLSGIHFWGIPQIPDGATVSGSLEVITSSWAYIGPVPLATLGAAYYLTTVVLAVWWLDTRHPIIIKLLTPITATGVVASAYFVWLQLVPIGEICPFCMVSAGATVVLFGLELAILRESTTPPLREILGELEFALGETNVAVVVVPLLVGLTSVVGMFLIPLLPLPDPVPFA